jgi:hypothetical protein
MAALKKVRIFNDLVGRQQAVTAAWKRLYDGCIVSDSQTDTRLAGMRGPFSDAFNDLVFDHPGRV